MKPIYFSAFLSLILLAPSCVNAAGAMLRVTCQGDEVGAEVYVNGQFRGECPVDFKAPAGRLKLRVVKKMDAAHERVFEREFRMAEDSVKKVEALLSVQLTAEAQRLEDARLAKERAEAAKREAAHDAALAVLRQQGIEPGKSFRDCPDCPEMVMIPSNVGVFAMGKYEVTQAQWQAVMGGNPSNFTQCGGNCPVENVSWNDIQEFIRKLNAKTGKRYRLPTEAEWEYACQGGSQTEYCGGNDVDAVAWYEGNTIYTTYPVGQKQANGYGLYDMSGNVLEWMQDKYDNEHDWRVMRGGSWGSRPQDVRSAKRDGNEPAEWGNSLGFRLAMTLP